MSDFSTTRVPVLSVRDLTISFPSRCGSDRVRVVRNVSFELTERSILSIVGESGSGKSLTALSLTGLLPVGAKIEEGRAEFQTKEKNSIDLFGLSESSRRRIRGRELAMIFQEPMSSLNPVLTIGEQITEAVRLHTSVSPREARDRAADALQSVGITDPVSRLRQYPHEFSGGMRQRAMIAMALSCTPRILIADEPTTALDVTVQAQVLDLLCRLRDERGLSIILITHDLRLVARRADAVCVMQRGEIVEHGSRAQVLESPTHQYTRSLLACVPRIGERRPRLATIAEA
ncbi:MAG: ABC transporter ATP-binding protein [Phycisphaerae bacterium]|nr:ABC transporter ATP-binding protein [Phycisphaerae bacterium]